MHLRVGPSMHYKGSPDENCVFSEMSPACPCVFVWASFFPSRVIRVLCVGPCVQCPRSIIVACCVGIKKPSSIVACCVGIQKDDVS